MSTRRIACAITILFFICTITASAETYRMNASYFVRSSDKFGSQDDNKIGVLTKGSTFTVKSRKKLSNGAEALQIRVVGLSPTSHVTASQEYWIYKPNNTDFIKRPSSGDTAAQAPEIPCDDCSNSSSPLGTKNANNIASISDSVITQQNQPGSSGQSPTVSENLTQSLDEKIKAYSRSDFVKKAIIWGLKNKSTKSRGFCYRTVKEALANQCGWDIKGKNGRVLYHCDNPLKTVGDKLGPGDNLIPKVYSDLAALNAKKTLKQKPYNFINLLEVEPYKTQIKRPSQAPKGSVLVYSSGIPCGKLPNRVADCGHIEIKTDDAGKPGYVSDYYSKDAINETPAARKFGSRYKLVGVMIKP